MNTGFARFAHFLLGWSAESRPASKILVNRVALMWCSPQQTLFIRASALSTVEQLKPRQPRLLRAVFVHVKNVTSCVPRALWLA